MFDVSLAVAFTAGIVSFLSPCVLPIIPGYLSYISGVGVEDVTKNRRLINFKVFISALFFVLGFIIIFTLLGASASFIGSFLKNYQREIAQVGGGVVIFFGLHFSGLFLSRHLNKIIILFVVAGLIAHLLDIITRRELLSLYLAIAIAYGLYLLKAHHLLYRQARPEVRTKVSFLGAFILGIVFALGWSPCIGPVLGSILLYASQKETVMEGAILLLAYSSGLAIPFLVSGLLFSAFIEFIKNFGKYFKYVEITGGVLLITLGVLLAVDKLSLLSDIATF